MPRNRGIPRAWQGRAARHDGAHDGGSGRGRDDLEPAPERSGGGLRLTEVSDRNPRLAPFPGLLDMPTVGAWWAALDVDRAKL